MRTMLRKSALIAAALVALVGASLDTSPANAQARWHGGGGGGWHGGGWRGGGWGWRGYGWGFGTGLAVGLGAPYYGYYGYPAYGGCALRPRWVVAPNGYRVRRWVRVCY
jgi:hypothetical protein